MPGKQSLTTDQSSHKSTYKPQQPARPLSLDPDDEKRLEQLESAEDAARKARIEEIFSGKNPQNEFIAALIAQDYATNPAKQLTAAKFLASTNYVAILYYNLSSMVIGHLTQALKNNRTVENLNLGGCTIDVANMMVLAEFIKTNKSVRVLQLYNCDITDEALLLLADALKENDSLRQLAIFNNDITEQGLKYLLNTLDIYNRRLKRINLGGNQIALSKDVNVLTDILKVIQNNRTLLDFNIQGNGTGWQVANASIVKELKKNREFQEQCLAIYKRYLALCLAARTGIIPQLISLVIEYITSEPDILSEILDFTAIEDGYPSFNTTSLEASPNKLISKLKQGFFGKPVNTVRYMDEDEENILVPDNPNWIYSLL